MSENYRSSRSSRSSTGLPARSLGDARRSTRRPRAERRPARPAGPPPVVVRSDRAVTPVEPIQRNRPKRRYEMALNVPGAQVRLPSLPQISVSWRLASGILFVLLAALLFHWVTSPSYQVDLAEIQGNQRLTSSDVNTVLGLAGQSIFGVDPLAVRQGLEKAFPEFKSIQVQVRFPAQVIVTVEERQPVLAWQQDDQLMWVDADGVAFAPRGEAANPLMVVDAKDAPPGTQAGLFRNAAQFDPRWIAAFQALAVQAPEGANLLYSRDRGLGWIAPEGWQVFFGSELTDIEQKLLVYQALADRLQQEGVTPALISVEYIHAPYYRLEP